MWVNITRKTNKNNKTRFYGNKQLDNSHYGTTGSEYHITGFNEPHKIIRYGRGFQGMFCRHHTIVNDRGLFPAHATCTRKRLSYPDCYSKAYLEYCIPLQGLYWTIDYTVNRKLDRNQMDASLPLTLYIKGRIFSLLVLPVREKAIRRAPLVTKHVKEDYRHSMPRLNAICCLSSMTCSSCRLMLKNVPYYLKLLKTDMNGNPSS